MLSATSATLEMIPNRRSHPLLLVTQTVKNLPAMQETWSQSLGQEDPLEKGMETALFPHTLTPVFLSGDFHGQKRLVGCSSCGHKESDITEQLLLTHRLYQEESLLE